MKLFAGRQSVCALIPILILGAGSLSAATTRFVDVDFCPGPGAGTEAEPYCTIGEAIDVSLDGDTILVAAGTYLGEGNVDLDFEGRAIVLKSLEGPKRTLISGQGRARGFIFQSGETAEAVVDGFTVHAASAPDAEHGGALSITHGSNPTIRNCIFRGNLGILGGAVFIQASSPTFERCSFRVNVSAFGRGGAIAINEDSHPSITNCEFIANNAYFGRGGAISVEDSDPVLTNLSIHGNTASFGGGGIYSTGGFTEPRARPIVRNSIIWDNIPNSIVDEGGAETSVFHCSVEGGWEGAGELNIAADPLFVLPSYEDRLLTDLRLRIGSRCIDSGDNSFLAAAVDQDLSGDQRFVDDPESLNMGTGSGPLVDMGAFEFQSFDTVVFRSDGRTLFWGAVAGAESYHVYRGTLGDFVNGAFGHCFDTQDPNLADTSFRDPETPLPGEGFFYLFAPVDGSGVEHGLGAGTDGLPRIPATGC